MNASQIIAGGVFCDPWDFKTLFLEHWYAATKAEVYYTASKYISPHRITDPDFGEVMAMRLRLARNDQAVATLTDFYRCEARADANLVPWGQPVTYHWRSRVGIENVFLGATSKIIVGQAHDMNSGNIGRNPTFDKSIEGNADGTAVMNFRFNRDATAEKPNLPTGDVVYSKPVTPRMHEESTLQAMWADGFHVPAEQGWWKLYDGDVLVAQGTGLNTWVEPGGGGAAELYAPFQKWGVYQAGYNYAWWQGKALDMSFSAALTIAGAITPAEIREYVGSRMRAKPAAAVQYA